MPTETPSRLLTIGEFAAATQLSPKALRLYDEQRLLPPIRVDAITGYRHYRSDQVAAGRLIRTLRDMGLSLAQIAQVLAARGVPAEQLLLQFAREGDRRYATEKRAFQTALTSMRHPAQSDAPRIVELRRPAMTVCVRQFLADQQRFVESYNAELGAALVAIRTARLTIAGDSRCVLVDPLSEDEARLEVVTPVVPPSEIAHGITLRHWSPAVCAAVSSESRTSHASDLTATLDAMFDWFDQQGHRAIEPPSVAIANSNVGLRTEIQWAYEPAVGKDVEAG